MLQIIKEVLKNKDDKTNLILIFANNSEADILLKKQLDDLAKKHSNFKVVYVLSTPSSAWKGERGFVSKELLARHLPG